MFGTSHLNTSYGLTGISRRFRFNHNREQNTVLHPYTCNPPAYGSGNPDAQNQQKLSNAEHSVPRHYDGKSWLILSKKVYVLLFGSFHNHSPNSFLIQS